MDLILDLPALVKNDKTLEKHTLETFEEVLKTCHNLIKRYNKEQVKHMNYAIPMYIFGKPKYDAKVLKNFLIYHLTDNGLLVRDTSEYEIYISWSDKDINIDKYVQRQRTIDRKDHDAMIGKPVKPLNSIEVLRFRQERQKQLSVEREERFKKQAEMKGVRRPYYS